MPVFSGLPSFISFTKCVHSSPQPFEVDLDVDIAGSAIGSNGVIGRSGDASLASEGGLGKGFSSTLDFWLLCLLFSMS